MITNLNKFKAHIDVTNYHLSLAMIDLIYMLEQHFQLISNNQVNDSSLLNDILHELQHNLALQGEPS